jgi:tetratricopeptide (TPR) repeat protein
MKNVRNSMMATLMIAILSGCAAMGVPATSDPARKLGDANALLELQRPFPAEKLIIESIQIYKEQNNEKGLAEAYRAYGTFFRSTAVGESPWRKSYEERGFLDKSAKFESRYSKSIEYYMLADNIYERLDFLERRSNVHLNMGITYELAGDLPSACKAYSESLRFNTAALQKDPTIIIFVPPPYKTFAEGLAPFLKRAQCE